jgi:hypothetical protein
MCLLIVPTNAIRYWHRDTNNTQVMAHALNIPTRLRFWRVPVEWTLLKSDFVTRFTGRIQPGVEPREIDGESYWKKFFKLPEGDDLTLFGFFSEVGLWQCDPPAAFVNERADKYIPYEVGGRFVSTYIPSIDPAQVWLFRKNLIDSLPNRQRFIKEFAASSSLTSDRTDAMRDLLYNQFVMRFELDGKQPCAVVNTVSLREMILAINYRDFARGARYQICQRADCPEGGLFIAEGKRKRKYCTWYCGHLVSKRAGDKKRAKEKKRGKKR